MSGAVCTHSLQNILQQHARTFVGDGQGAEEELVGGGDAEAAAQHDDQVGTAVFYQPGGEMCGVRIKKSHHGTPVKS